MDHEENLNSHIQRVRAEFTARLGKDFELKKRATDMRQVFTMTCRQKYKALRIPWLKKHTALAKILFTNYSPDLLQQMMRLYVDDERYHRERGISFDGFYYCSARLATDLAAKENKAVAVEKIKKVSEPDDPSLDEVEAFKASPFFKKLGNVFKEKI